MQKVEWHRSVYVGKKFLVHRISKVFCELLQTMSIVVQRHVHKVACVWNQQKDDKLN